MAGLRFGDEQMKNSVPAGSSKDMALMVPKMENSNIWEVFVIHLKRKPFKAIGFQYKNDVVQPGLYEGYFKDEGWIVTLFKRNPSDKLCKVESQKYYYDAVYRFGLSFRLQYLKNHYSSVGNLNFAYYTNDSQTETKDDLNTSEIWLGARYSYGEKFLEKKYKRYSLGSDFPVYQLNLIKGLKNFWDGEFNYFKVTV